MKLLVLLAASSSAVAVSGNLHARKQSQISVAVQAEDIAGCISNALKFIEEPVTKDKAIERAKDHCAMDKQIDDGNFVCPHYIEVLHGAFWREPTTKEYNAESFCGVAETYANELKNAAEIPNIGEGSGSEFEVSKDCKPFVAGMLGHKPLKAESVPDFWYSLCMNQDCAHFLPSRTKWCNKDHRPFHAASVCEAMRLHVQDEISNGGQKGLSFSGHKEFEAEEVCNMYGGFVESTHANVQAYEHVVHGKKEDQVPVPADKSRALQSSKMKNEAGKHQIRDASGNPVKNTAVSPTAATLAAFASAFIHHALAVQ